MAQYDAPLGEGGIEWTGATWNPVTGCDKVSQGCKFCYAETMAERLARMGNPRYLGAGALADPDGDDSPFAVRLHRDKLAEPLGWRTPLWVFVNSMSDLLHESVPLDFIVDAFATMSSASWHRFQVLTKRPERWGEVTAAVVARLGGFPRNVLPGTSVEDARALARLPHLRRAGDDDSVRMVSAEPLLGSLCAGAPAQLAEQLRAGGVGWLIAGGEAGWHARPADETWFREVRDACALAQVPFFFKQHGGRGTTRTAKRGGDLAALDGQVHHAMPEVWASAPAPRGGRRGR